MSYVLQTTSGVLRPKSRDETVERKVGFSGKYKQNVMNGCVVLAKRVKNTGVGNPLLITSCLKNATGRNT